MFVCPSKPLGSERTTKAFGIRGETLEKNSPLVRPWPPDRCHGKGISTEIQRGMKLKKQRECDGGGFKYVLFLARKFGEDFQFD